jgi:hypothetical protein
LSHDGDVVGQVVLTVEAHARDGAEALHEPPHQAHLVRLDRGQALSLDPLGASVNAGDAMMFGVPYSSATGIRQVRPLGRPHAEIAPGTRSRFLHMRPPCRWAPSSTCGP